jgi:NhaA family Na+:H+ antiporter
MNEEGTDLPTEIADRLTRPFARILKIKVATGVMLFVATVAALTLSNSKWSVPFLAFWDIPIGLHFGALDFTRSLRLWINEGLMTLFFFVVALELKHSLVLGKLHTLRVAALSFAGALGGMLVPATLYVALMNNQLGMHRCTVGEPWLLPTRLLSSDVSHFSAPASHRVFACFSCRWQSSMTWVPSWWWPWVMEKP